MDKTALLKKIRALAEHGVGGEAENAEKLLARMMKKYGISEEELNSARIALPPKRWKSSIFSISIKDFGKKKRTLSSRPTFKSTVSLQYAQT